ncbi:hypothetical protein Tco_1265129 [Tanacetum coccineum]
MRKVNTYVLIKSEGDRAVPKLATGSSKRDAEEELDQESSKRQKTGESSELAEEPKDKEADELSHEELQQTMIIVPEQGMNVESLQTKLKDQEDEVFGRILLRSNSKKLDDLEANHKFRGRLLGIKGFLTVTTAGSSYNCWLELLLLLKIEEKVLSHYYC